MMSKKTIFSLGAAICMFFLSTSALSGKTKILLVPLDDRSTSVQFPPKMGLIADAEVVIPPVHLLGRFMEAGNSDGIIHWLRKQNLREYSAAIVVMDMLAYGGLVASRNYEISQEKALARVSILADLRKAAPGLKIYAQNVMMRLALTWDGNNAGYYHQFTEWAKIAHEEDPDSRNRTRILEKQLPKEVVHNYWLARKRNLAVNMRAVEYVEKGVIDFLILSQDDASPKGVHIADREQLKHVISKKSLQEKIAVQPGADEVAMLLLARSLNDLHQRRVTVQVIYSSPSKRTAVMPFEDVPLHETVSRHIKAVGGTEVSDAGQADVDFFVFASRDEPGRAEAFASDIAKRVREGRSAIVADVDPKGDVQGGDERFTNALLGHGVFSALSGYASWNTAGNTIGTALPHGVVFNLAEKQLTAGGKEKVKLLQAQHWFMIHRIMDDFYYHNLVRKKVNAFAKQEGASSNLMDDGMRQKAERYAAELLTAALDDLWPKYAENGSPEEGLACRKPDHFSFSLPWNRTFEADIDFKLHCDEANVN